MIVLPNGTGYVQTPDGTIKVAAGNINMQSITAAQAADLFADIDRDLRPSARVRTESPASPLEVSEGDQVVITGLPAYPQWQRTWEVVDMKVGAGDFGTIICYVRPLINLTGV